MNDVLASARMMPRKVITLYSDAQERSYYLTERAVATVAGKPVLLPAVPLPDETLKDIARSYADSKTVNLSHSGMIPDNIVYTYNAIGKTVVAWTRPALQTFLNVSHGLIKGDLLVKLPPLFFCSVNDSLYVFAMKDGGRPEYSTKLFHAPFMNVYVEGRVCLGSAKVGQRTKYFDKEVERFERGFFMAEQGGGCQYDIEKLSELWRNLNGKADEFPTSFLKPIKTNYNTVGDMLAKLSGNSLER
jgi:PRTRC genetic system protein B